VVHEFIYTEKPVGSKSLTERYSLGVSPATIRNELAVLEEQGYLSHPHTSAGRIPTDRGYRFYVDALSGVGELARAQEETIARFFEGRPTSRRPCSGPRCCCPASPTTRPWWPRRPSTGRGCATSRWSASGRT
jgi:hypothetical protein